MTSHDAMNTGSTTALPELARALEQELFAVHGPMMWGKALTAALGYPTSGAFRQAVARNTVPVTVFSIERRRGKFALSTDVALWLATQRQNARAIAERQLHHEKEVSMRA
jgi:hypothetical protein